MVFTAPRLIFQFRRYREEIIKKRKAEQEIEAQPAAYEAELRGHFEPQTQEMAADLRLVSANRRPVLPKPPQRLL